MQLYYIKVYSDIICFVPYLWLCEEVFYFPNLERLWSFFPHMWFLYVFSILKKKLFNLVISWKAFKQVGELIFTLLLLGLSVGSHSLYHPSSPAALKKNNNNKHDMIILLITEPGNTKENCGIWRKMPRASPVRSAVFSYFFSLSWICLWLFWPAEAYPHNLTKPQQIPNATTPLCSKGVRRKAGPGWLRNSPARVQGRKSK